MIEMCRFDLSGDVHDGLKLYSVVAVPRKELEGVCLGQVHPQHIVPIARFASPMQCMYNGFDGLKLSLVECPTEPTRTASVQRHHYNGIIVWT